MCWDSKKMSFGKSVPGLSFSRVAMPNVNAINRLDKKLAVLYG